MFDLDPWDKISLNRISAEPKIPNQFKPIFQFFNQINNKIKNWFRQKVKIKKKDNSINQGISEKENIDG
jgi:hypothetical protein